MTFLCLAGIQGFPTSEPRQSTSPDSIPKASPSPPPPNRHDGLQGDGSFYGDLSECNKTLGMLLVCVESSKIPLLCKLKKLYTKLEMQDLVASLVDNVGEYPLSIRATHKKDDVCVIIRITSSWAVIHDQVVYYADIMPGSHVPCFVPTLS